MAKQKRSRLAGRVARSRIGRVAVFPARVRKAGRQVWRVTRTAVRWLGTSREYTNFTYDLQDFNVKQMAAFAAMVAGVDYDRAAGWIEELETDDELRAQLAEARTSDPQWRLSDPYARYARRAAWYAIVRGLQPDLVVETGTDKGLGTMVLAAAVLRNGKGKVITIDTQEKSGYLIGGKWATVIDRRIGNSLDVLPGIEGIDVFLHDSLHTEEHENGEYRIVTPKLAPNGILMSDNAHHASTFLDWTRQHGMRFVYFHEIPKDHWYPGAGLGVGLPADRTL